MEKKSFKTSAFGLAKEKELVSDDFYEVKVIDDLCIAILCDGVGSAKKGQEASRRVVRYLINNFKNRPQSWSIEKSLITFIKNINTILYRESIEEYENVEYLSTLCAVIIEGDRLYGANVGDSRIYLYRDKKLNQLSNDHSMDEKGMEHILTKAIGLEEQVEPYYFENNLQKDDFILLCSDGLSNLLNQDEISSKIPLGATALVKYASKKVNDDLPDDTSAIVVKYNGIKSYKSLKQTDLEIPQTLKKDQIIDGYKLLKPLIENQRTWLVEKNSKKYVMKFPEIIASEDEKILDLYIKEAWNAARLKAGFFPKAVIPINRSMRYYIMQYVEGETLKEVISKKPLKVEDTITLAKTLLGAASYLLKFDLVHGDIKPENIIMTKNRHGKNIFKIIDFGSIVETFSITNKAGTPSYIAPERFKGEAISEQTEIFAIGVVLYEALTKKLPYGEIEPFQTPTFKQPKPIRDYNKNVPYWLESIVMHSIQADQTKRYKNYSEMEYELTHPDKVKPYFKDGASIFEREPAKVYKILFVISFILNIVLIMLLLK